MHADTDKNINKTLKVEAAKSERSEKENNKTGPAQTSCQN